MSYYKKKTHFLYKLTPKSPGEIACGFRITTHLAVSDIRRVSCQRCLRSLPGESALRQAGFTNPGVGYPIPQYMNQ